VIIKPLIIKSNINIASIISQYRGLKISQPKNRFKNISKGKRHPVRLKNTKDFMELFLCIFKKIAFPPLAGSAIGVIGDNFKRFSQWYGKAFYTFLYHKLL